MKRLVCCLLCVSAACVGPARTDRVYEGKAVDTAKAVLSAVETAKLASRTAAGKATGQYLSIILRDAEEQADAASGAFDSIQPPSPRSEELHADLSSIIDDAVDGLRAMRVAARRTELRALHRLSRDLAAAATDLNRFVEAHE